MPVGIIIDCMSVFVGGIFGALGKKILPQSLKDTMPLAFGMCAIAMGINSIIKAESMLVVFTAMLVGFAVGHLLRLDVRVQDSAKRLLKRLIRGESEDSVSMMVCAFTVFCCSGFGWYGAIIEAISGDPDILISKSVLDCFTALIFATTLRFSVCLLAIPQFVLMLAVYGVSQLGRAFASPEYLANLNACGGIITLGAGLRMAKIKMIPVVDMAPALALVMLFAIAASYIP